MTATKAATNVHVHLFYGADPRTYRKGENIGCLYGYHHAESDEFRLTYSQDGGENRVASLARRALKTALGFDVVHAWRNRAALLNTDVIWTHTEQEHLAAALILKLAGAQGKRPLLLAQSVWLFDKWGSFGGPRRWLYRKLIARADALTTLARDNADLCRRYLGRDAEFVYYGLNTQDFPITEPRQWQPNRPLRIAAIGNDRDRDWRTFLAAFGGDERYDVRLATRRRVPREWHAPNVKIGSASGLAKQHELYAWADVIVVPLRPNFHASGITVMLEAAAVGKPMIVSDVGGLSDYFPHDTAAYVPAFDAQAMRQAADRFVADPVAALACAQAAAACLRDRDLTTQAFAEQHVRITRDMLRRRRTPAAAGVAMPLADSRPSSR
ncbi:MULTISPECIES: glycosyltransferase family 4 protein [unclassified Burkholderia]|uniref:glycosyltransferase family 4 protein n=1 Tax=unclassified Burkholderia TaxID=2613784 RepID=UPI0014222A75|nr:MULTISPECIES: glycosyltransferase family 4 protein [unclassified Burkholderia]NIE54953.1 glycosyltransferase family 4 protein [Burkholderia sp. Ap-955]NIF11585.1 glycosyltransferase family 4 protein [Burkholderia sp. Ax-1735]NIG05353.1 glycosyltransferase family 4 protein [Burkholderia sp. Tr-849]